MTVMTALSLGLSDTSVCVCMGVCMCALSLLFKGMSA